MSYIFVGPTFIYKEGFVNLHSLYFYYSNIFVHRIWDFVLN